MNPLRFSPNLLCHCLALILYDEIIFNWDAFSWGTNLNPDWLSEGRNLRCFQCQSFTCCDYTARASWIQMEALGGHQQAYTIWLPLNWPSRKRYCIWSVCSLPGRQPVPHAQLFFNHPHTLSRRKCLRSKSCAMMCGSKLNSLNNGLPQHQFIGKHYFNSPFVASTPPLLARVGPIHLWFGNKYLISPLHGADTWDIFLWFGFVLILIYANNR